MLLSRLGILRPLITKNRQIPLVQNTSTRNAISTKRGVILQEPHRTTFGIIKLVLTVVPGLLIGAAISKSIANFLEENDLFVPSDEDDDDD